MTHSVDSFVVFRSTRLQSHLIHLDRDNRVVQTLLTGRLFVLFVCYILALLYVKPCSVISRFSFPGPVFSDPAFTTLATWSLISGLPFSSIKEEENLI